VIERDGREPSVIAGADTIGARVPSALGAYRRTFHFVGQQRVDIDGDDATGETYCIAQHLSDRDDGRWNHIMNIRYQDRFRRSAAGRRFAERRLCVDWVEDRPVASG
jgi:hypothetical protein